MGCSKNRAGDLFATFSNTIVFFDRWSNRGSRFILRYRFYLQIYPGDFFKILETHFTGKINILTVLQTTQPPSGGQEFFTCNFDADTCPNALMSVPAVTTGNGPEFEWTRDNGKKSYLSCTRCRNNGIIIHYWCLREYK